VTIELASFRPREFVAAKKMATARPFWNNIRPDHRTRMANHNDSITTIFFALGANAFIALAKGIAAWLTGSSAMLAEAVHSVADCGNQGLLLLWLKRSARPPDAEFPIGHGKAIYF
jgi:divalent metal cation (Fe/Co/Zn/Cd) transporter